MDNKKEPLELHEKIIIYLAENPAKTIIEIQLGVNSNYHSAISRAIKELTEMRLTASVGKFQPEHGPPVNQWGLTNLGIYDAIIHVIDSSSIIRKYISNYTKFYENLIPALKELEAIIQVTDKEKQDQVIKDYFKMTYILMEEEIESKPVYAMLTGLLMSELGEDSYIKMCKILEGDKFDESAYEGLRKWMRHEPELF